MASKVSLGIATADFDPLLRQVERMLEECGGPAGFDARAWLTAWLDGPLPAYGGRKPIDYLGTAEGFDLVSRTLAQMQSGAFA